MAIRRDAGVKNGAGQAVGMAEQRRTTRKLL